MKSHQLLCLQPKFSSRLIFGAGTGPEPIAPPHLPHMTSHVSWFQSFSGWLQLLDHHVTVCRVSCDALCPRRFLKKPRDFSWAVTIVMSSSDALLPVPKRSLEEMLRRLEMLEKTVQEMLAELSPKPETSTD